MSQVDRVPKVTLGLPVFNGADFIDQCLRSIFEQTFPDFELIVCDNGSTDKTCEIVEEWCRKDSRARLYRSTVNRGAAANFNWAFSLARGEFFKWCAADDLLEPTFLSSCVGALEANPDAVLAYTGVIDIDDEGRVLGEIFDNRSPYEFGSYDASLRFRDLVCIDHSCVSVFGLIRRSALKEASPIAPYVGSDRVLLAKLGIEGRFIRIPDNLFLHREHEGRSVNAHPKMQDRAAWFDPTRTGVVFPHFRRGWEYTWAAIKYSKGIRGRAANLFRVMQWVYWHGWRNLLSDLMIYRPRRER